MNKACKFLRECGAFMLLTLNGDRPAGRPFGAVTEIGGALYISAGAGKPVFKQLHENANVQIVALKAGTRDWVRIDGVCEECFDLQTKRQILLECPNLLKYHPSAEDETFHAFCITPSRIEMHTQGGVEIETL